MVEALPRVLYLAGPMTGLPDFNYPAFNSAAGRLRAAGFEVLNPADNKPEIPDWVGYMREALGQLVRADAVAVLPGYADSRGARLETQLAVELEMSVRPVRAWLTEARHRAYIGRLLETSEAGK
ncbi:deoxycytidylate deaminase [Arthrobacter phage Kuleana]|uniref:Deoxycytidylate deaminase n=1 Tax=Arthrobacter phage Kuleana TaxID=2653270 RepID=A0A5Q2WC43_9CAUD|nr:deoxycytidylate deaminase [Arthrobacter phage Kuleana]QGH74541.1 deoxycytidylate deaminase [Arthrobacter phage Kuleana]